MDIHIASNQLSSALPQGFSIYQPALGAQLQFFPAMGSKELDDMLHAYLPGPAPIADKRAAVSVDFLEQLHLTGQTFKFYQVEAPIYIPSASASSSPGSASGASSLSGFPATPTWDFNSIAFTPSSTSSQASTSALKARKAAKAASVSRHQTTDFSHLPGMKIMTKDGVDVTNAASRGSKTKEQRDHAHLMRIIKACDSCRAKKIRCDPSHKRRAASTAASHATPTPTPPPSKSKQNKKRTVSKPTQSDVSIAHIIPTPSLAPTQDFNWEEFDVSMAMAGIDNFDDFTNLHDPWSEFAFPEDAEEIDYHKFLEIDDSFSPTSSFTQTTTSSGSSTKPHSPTSAFVYGEEATPSTTVTNRSSSTDDEHHSWSQDHGLTLTAEPNSYPARSLSSAIIDDGVLHVDASDGSGVPGDHGIDATLLSSTDTRHSRHRLEDPGVFANTASSPGLFNATPGSSGFAPFAHSDATLLEPSLASSPGEAMDRQAMLLGQSPLGMSALPTKTAVHESERALVRASLNSSVVDAAPIAPQSQSRPLIPHGGRGGILGLLPVSGPAVPGLDQLMLGGTSELIAASAPLSSDSLSALLMTVAYMATSFVASVDKLLTLGRLDQALLPQQQATSRKAEVTSCHRRMPWASPAHTMPSIVRVC